MEDSALDLAADTRLVQSVKAATDTMDKALSLDADTADTQVKYAEWIALLATGGFAATVANADKIRLRFADTHPRAGASVLAAALVTFVLTVLLSAWVLKSFIAYRALYRKHRSLIAAQSVALSNHPRLVTAMVEVNSILEGESPEDQLYDDIVRGEGGSVVALQAVSFEPPSAENYDQQKVRLQAERLAERLRLLSAGIKSAVVERSLYSRRLNVAGNVQLIMAAVAYILLTILVFI